MKFFLHKTNEVYILILCLFEVSIDELYKNRLLTGVINKITKIKKRDGRIVPFDKLKITNYL